MKEERVSVRLDAETVRNIDVMADRLTRLLGRRVTRSDVIRLALWYGIPLVEADINDLEAKKITRILGGVRP